MSGAALAAGYATDAAFGDPRRWHPVAGFGHVALEIERRAYAPTRKRGAAYAIGLIAATALAVDLAVRLARRAPRGEQAALAAVTWAALGGRSLVHEARRLATHVGENDLEAARRVLPALCGRDPEALDAEALCRATVESVAENTADAVVGPLLWGALAGPTGIAIYRAANTLDAMVGHRSDRYAEFGWAAARIDDVLNWPVARLTALLAAVGSPLVSGSPWRVVRTVLADGASHPSPNAGRAEAAFAGALDVQLGGPLAYAGRAEVRPILGTGRAPETRDVRRATRLSLVVGVAAAGLCAATRSAR